MEKDPKTLLQEYCHRYKLPLPKYTTTNTINGKFKSTVCCVQNIHKITVDSDEFPSKKEAEKQAAGRMLDIINSQNKPVSEYKYLDNIIIDNTIIDDDLPATPKASNVKPLARPNTNEFIILIDLENIQPNIVNVYSYHIELFASVYATVLDKYRQIIKEKNLKLNLIDSAASEAADHLMTFTACRLSLAYPEKKFIIVSRDKSSEIIVKLLQLNGHKVEHFKSNCDIDDVLK